MKKIIILLMVLFLMGCSKAAYTDHQSVSEYVLGQALNIEFEEFNNLTATSGDLKITMRHRLEVFEPYLTDDAYDSFKNRETYWYGVWQVSGRQLDLSSDTFNLTLIEDQDDLKIYAFKADVQLSFLESDLVIDKVQEGQIELIEKGNKWQINELKYSNDIFKDIDWP